MLIPAHPVQKSLADFSELFMRQATAAQAGRQPIHARLNDLFEPTRILEPINPEIRETQSDVALVELLDSVRHFVTQRFNVATKQTAVACMMAVNSVACRNLRMDSSGQIAVSELGDDPEMQIEIADALLTRAGKGAHTGLQLLAVIAWHPSYWSEHLQGSRKTEIATARTSADNLLKFIVALPSLSMQPGPEKNAVFREELRLHDPSLAGATPEKIENVFWEANTAEAQSAEAHTALAGKLCDYLALQPAPLEPFVMKNRHIRNLLQYIT